MPQEPIASDHRGYIEILIAARRLQGPDFVDLLLGARSKFGAKPLLVVCNGPAHGAGIAQAFRNGVELANRLRARIAIVLNGRQPTDMDRLVELVARNRGADVRFLPDIAAAKTWLRVD
jgi:hypothetical protein